MISTLVRLLVKLLISTSDSGNSVIGIGCMINLAKVPAAVFLANCPGLTQIVCSTLFAKNLKLDGRIKTSGVTFNSSSSFAA